MAKVRDVYNYIDSFAPFASALGYDNVGILVGEGEDEVLKAVIALDITKNVIDMARKENAGLIISHHPVIFNPVKRLEKKMPAYMLASSGISAICAHTNLDMSHEFGVNTCLAKALGIENCTFPIENEPLAIGELKNEISAQDFVSMIKEKLKNPNVTFSKIKKMIKKIAFIGGAGGEFVYAAAELGADAFVTGEIKHHEFISAYEEGLLAVCAGHYSTEAVVLSPLKLKLSEKFPDVEFILSEGIENPCEF